MKTMDEIIHMDDWKRVGIIVPTDKFYSESEIKVMMRRYAEEVSREFVYLISECVNNGEFSIRFQDEINKQVTEIENEIAKQVLI